MANQRSFIESTLAQLMSDGLSRRLSSQAYNTSLPVRYWVLGEFARSGNGDESIYFHRLLTGKPNAVDLSGTHPGQVIQRLDFSVQGLGYRAFSTTTYIATIIASVYVLITSAHVVWTLWRRVTSSSWDTFSELLLLAFNSEPAHAFHGTSAQIERWRTYKLILRIHTRTHRATPMQSQKSACSYS